jgi:hypothetical protein
MQDADHAIQCLKIDLGSLSEVQTSKPMIAIVGDQLIGYVVRDQRIRNS